jgi:predicted dehydrogenase
MMVFKIGIIGFGNIGKKRFNSINEINNTRIKIEYIVDANKKVKFPNKIKYYNNFLDIKSINVDLIIVALPTNISEKIVKELVGRFNLLVEKPISTNLRLINSFIKKSNSNNKILKIGYNLRFDEGLMMAKKIFDKKKIGDIYYAKISYANGAARTNTNKVGSLHDMGSHSLNLLQWFFDGAQLSLKYTLQQSNEFLRRTKTDNGFSIFKINNFPCFFHHGFCNWKNLFKFEIYGSKGYLDVSSLSKWGDQTVSHGSRRYPSGKPKIKLYKFKRDDSWKNEIIFVINAIINKSKNSKILINSESMNTLKVIKNIEYNENF